MIARGIREHVSRDWEAVRENKDVYWGERIRRLGAGEGFRIAEELRHQALQRDPTWPGAARREEDLQSHVRIALLLRRASPTRCR